VVVALDHEDNANTERAKERWLRALWDAGLNIYVAVWEGEDVGGPKGIDDLVHAGGKLRIRRAFFIPAEIGQSRRPRPGHLSGAVEQGSNLEEVRSLTTRTVEDFLGHPRGNQGKALLVSTSPGVGETTAVASAIYKSGGSFRVAVGTKRLAKELSEQFGYILIEGRNENSCQRMDLIQALG
jgi:hypothetical protein